MKKFLSVLIASLMLTGVLAGCGQKTNTAPANSSSGTSTQAAAKKEPKDTLIALAISTTQNDFMAMVEKQLGDRFKAAGYKFESASADGNSQKQIEQIENFITMGASEIIVMAVENTSVTDVCKKAMEKGVKIYAFTTNTGSYDAFMGSDESKVGESIANLASKWVDKAFASAGDKTVNAVIFSYSGNPDAAARSKALASIAEKNKKVKITKTVELGDNNTDTALKATENLMQTNPETNVILCYNGSMAIGVNSYAMSPNSLIKDKSKFGVFGSELTTEVTKAIEDSKDNKSVLRGTAQLGGDIMAAFDNIVSNSIKMLNGEQYQKDDFAKIDEIDVDNIASFKH
ncbi:sugar ABC transporter substrate-binding protein [Clostridium sp. SYSU_GA19001]|uniref:sugar ABC transporter substrate-binding protein n=1 Tax=Clostridium caldaquaticum TaxID=2940653 RepID=UPI00207753C0|nr:sugar ABC transporter substrate-binding protein [Clostridium caldaquaticum]MCM8709981.1 sugar ABC transporter substrate-binding protein [Clostridium caldaquaticum]